MKITRSLLPIAALLFAGCQKEISDFAPQPQTPVKDTTVITPPTLPGIRDTATLMIRDAISDVNAFYLEPLYIEVNTVPQANWLRGNYASAGTHKFTTKAPLNAAPSTEFFEYGNYRTSYRNPNYVDNYNSTVLSTKVLVERNDGGIVAYRTKANPTTGQTDTLGRYHAVFLEAAEEVRVYSPPVGGVNPMTNGVSNSVSHQATLRANSALGQNGDVYRFQ